MGTLEIIVGPVEASTAADAGAVTARPVRTVQVASWDALSRTLSSKRLDLLRHLARSPAPSVRQLATALARDYKNVHADVEALCQAGLIRRGDDGLRVDFAGIIVRLAL